MSKKGLRLVLYDDTCRSDIWWRVGLTHSWVAGVKLYRLRGAIDAAYGITSWTQGILWLLEQSKRGPIAEVQYWGHGKWGRAQVDQEHLNVQSLESAHALSGLLADVRDVMAGPDSLWWFRTCETFGADVGQDFAQAWSEFFECRVAGHTYVIGPFQSGLHVLSPGQTPTWSPDEGLIEGTADEPERAAMSHPSFSRTITCLHSKIPKGWG